MFIDVGTTPHYVTSQKTKGIIFKEMCYPSSRRIVKEINLKRTREDRKRWSRR
jgi:hypothetical protein